MLPCFPHVCALILGQLSQYSTVNVCVWVCVSHQNLDLCIYIQQSISYILCQWSCLGFRVCMFLSNHDEERASSFCVGSLHSQGWTPHTLCLRASPSWWSGGMCMHIWKNLGIHCLTLLFMQRGGDRIDIWTVVDMQFCAWTLLKLAAYIIHNNKQKT